MRNNHPTALMRLVLAYAPGTPFHHRYWVFWDAWHVAPHDVTELLVAYARRPWLLGTGIPSLPQTPAGSRPRRPLQARPRAVGAAYAPHGPADLFAAVKRDAVFVHAFAEEDISRVPWTATSSAPCHTLRRREPHVSAWRPSWRIRVGTC